LAENVMLTERMDDARFRHPQRVFVDAVVSIGIEENEAAVLAAPERSERDLRENSEPLEVEFSLGEWTC
jgi:hypothetical protein